MSTELVSLSEETLKMFVGLEIEVIDSHGRTGLLSDLEWDWNQETLSASLTTADGNRYVVDTLDVRPRLFEAGERVSVYLGGPRARRVQGTVQNPVPQDGLGIYVLTDRKDRSVYVGTGRHQTNRL